MANLAGGTVLEAIAQARGGDRLALDQLFGRCRNYVHLLAQAQLDSRLQAKVDASDLVQQTLLEAYRSFPQFAGSTEAEWLAWLRRILEHNAADLVRHYQLAGKRQASREVPLAAGSGGGGAALDASPQESPSAQVIREEQELQMADALARLRPEHREVIVLRNLQRLPFEEVARLMNRSRPAAQMLWMRAMHRLQELLPREE